MSHLSRLAYWSQQCNTKLRHVATELVTAIARAEGCDR